MTLYGSFAVFLLIFAAGISTSSRVVLSALEGAVPFLIVRTRLDLIRPTFVGVLLLKLRLNGVVTASTGRYPGTVGLQDLGCV